MSANFQNTTTLSSIENAPAASELNIRLVAENGVNVEALPDLNNAELLGTSTDAMQALLQQPATLLTGALWGTRDTRNTQDGNWTPVSMPWLAWIMGGKGTGKGSTDWGFSNHPVSKEKEGQCIVLGSSIGQARKAKAMEYMYAMGLDIDSGANLDDVLAKLEKLGLFCLVATSFNHGRSGLQLKRDDVLRKLGIKTEPILAEVQDYLRRFDKSRYEEEFIAAVTIRTAKKQVKDGVVIELNTPPLDKMRLIFPLAEKVKLIDLAETHEAALEVWEDKITGLARETLGVHFDTSATDPSRLFYTGRHPKDAADWYCAVVQGDPIKFEDVPTMRKGQYTGSRTGDPSNPFSQAGEDLTKDAIPETVTPSGKSLRDWHRTFKSRFLIANLLEDYCGDRLVRDGTPPQGSVFLHCPFETEHTSEGGTGTMATNCIDSSSEYWTVHCKHDACQGRHKTQFLEEMLRQGWFEEDVIYDLEAGYLLEAEDGEESTVAEANPDSTVRNAELQTKIAADYESRASALTPQATGPEIGAVIGDALESGADPVALAHLKKAVMASTGQTAETYNQVFKDAKVKAKTKRKAKVGTGVEGLDLQSPFRARCDQIYQIMTKETDNPVIFHHNGLLVDVQVNEHGNPRMAEVKKDRFKAIVESRVDFFEGDRSRAADLNDINYVFNQDRNGYPALHRVIASPVFGPDMSLVTEPGYHAASGLMYRPRSGVQIAPVPAVPDMSEVAKAKLDLLDVLADFPFDGLTTRAEVIAAVTSGKDVPSFCHALSVGLTPLCRAFIKGPTPGHLARKDRPRTGATKLLSNVSQMAMLEAMAQPQSLPDNKSDVQKTIIAAGDSGQPFIFFDNLPDSGKVDFGELAAAITAWPRYTGRRLGVSELVEILMTATWLFTGNRTQLSPELAQRMILINLDPKMECPGDREGFKHNLDEHIPANAGRYLHAFLILVQNWIANGCALWEGKAMGGFESHNRIIGGILEAAGIKGFLTNASIMQDVGRVDSPEDMLMDAMIEATYSDKGRAAPGTAFRVWVTDKLPMETKVDGGKTAALCAGFHVVSIRDTLQSNGIALAHSGYAKGDDGAVFYPDAAKSSLAARVGAMVRAVRELTAEREENVGRQGRYVLTKAGTDKWGTFYTLERLELVGR